MPYKDPEKVKEYEKRRWREQKEKRQKNNKEYYKNNKAKVEAQKREYNAKNKGKIKERQKRWAQSPKGRFLAYKSGSKARGIGFVLSLEQFMRYWQQPCHYCGDVVPTIGLDRVDSDKGYTPENIVSCCEHCNYMKLEYPKELFFEHCFKILKHQGLIGE